MKFLLIVLLQLPSLLFAQVNRPILDTVLSNYAYPYPVSTLQLVSQRQQLQMRYMDVPPVKPNGSIVVLLHGKNFNGAYWKTTIAALTKEGYRVIVPDQVGFGKSSKPISYQFSFQQLAVNTKMLLDYLKVNKVTLLGHSMGGMLATRFALMYPAMINKLVLENPIGLEDWKRVVPHTPIDSLFKSEMKQDFAAAKKYQLENYYDGRWKPEYDEWVYLLTGWVKHPAYAKVAWNSALTSDMIFTQPVYYEFEDLRVPTLLIIGTRDRTAIGKQYVSDSLKATLGQYQLLGKAIQKKISGSLLVELEDVGHLPHIEAFEKFIEPLKTFLAK